MLRERWAKFRSTNYSASTLGRIKNGDRILRPYSRPDGRLVVDMRYVYGKAFFAHRIVAEVFLGRCPRGHQINHKDGNPKNNRISNLEYVTRQQNMRHASENGLVQRKNIPKYIQTRDKILGMKKAGLKNAEIARETGFSHSHISRTVRGLAYNYGVCK